MQSQVTFVDAVGVAPGTTSMVLRGAAPSVMTGPSCFPSPVSIAVLPDQSTWAAYKGQEPNRWRPELGYSTGAWVDPAGGSGYGPGTGTSIEGLMSLNGTGLNGTGTSIFQLLFGAALGYALAYAGTKAYKKWKTR